MVMELSINSGSTPGSNPPPLAGNLQPCLALPPLSSHTLPSPTPFRLAPPTCLVKPHSVQPSPAILYLLFTSWLLMAFSHLTQEPLFFYDLVLPWRGIYNASLAFSETELPLFIKTVQRTSGITAHGPRKNLHKYIRNSRKINKTNFSKIMRINPRFITIWESFIQGMVEYQWRQHIFLAF